MPLVHTHTDTRTLHHSFDVYLRFFRGINEVILISIFQARTNALKCPLDQNFIWLHIIRIFKPFTVQCQREPETNIKPASSLAVEADNKHFVTKNSIQIFRIINFQINRILYMYFYLFSTQLSIELMKMGIVCRNEKENIFRI